MKLEVIAKGLEVDAWLHDYIRTTVVFASWHHDVPQAARVQRRLNRRADPHRDIGLPIHEIQLAGGQDQIQRNPGMSLRKTNQIGRDEVETKTVRRGQNDLPFIAVIGPLDAIGQEGGLDLERFEVTSERLPFRCQLDLLLSP